MSRREMADLEVLLQPVADPIGVDLPPLQRQFQAASREVIDYPNSVMLHLTYLPEAVQREHP